MSRTSNLSGTLRWMFRGDNYCACWRERGRSYNTMVRYMEIPIDKDVFEMPIFAFDAFKAAIDKGMDTQANVIAVRLNTINKVPRYKTVDRYMRDVLIERYEDSRLVKLEVKRGDDMLKYYGCQGAIFDMNFNPIMVCSYQLERCRIINAGEEDSIKYKFLRPILRIDPGVFLSRADSMEKFIANKMLNACLENPCYLPMAYDLRERFIIFRGWDEHHTTVKVEIDKCPFLVHQVDTPSISTTNQRLLQIAIDHIEELIQ